MKNKSIMESNEDVTVVANIVAKNKVEVTFKSNGVCLLKVPFCINGDMVINQQTIDVVSKLASADILEARKAILRMLEENLFHVRNSIKLTEEFITEEENQ